MKRKQLKCLPLRCRTRLQVASLKRNRQLSSEDRKGHITCVTRTVELASSVNLSEEPSKLLFCLALGLGPSPDKPSPGPFVRMQRLKPEKEAEARALTRARLFEVTAQILKRLERKPLQKLGSSDQQPTPGSSSKDKSGSNEIIDLVSSDDEADENTMHLFKVPAPYRKRVLGQVNRPAPALQKPCPASKKKLRRSLEESGRKPRRNAKGAGAKPLKNSQSESKLMLSWTPSRVSSTVRVKKFPAGLTAPQPYESSSEIEGSVKSSGSGAPKTEMFTVITID